jgi:Rv2632c-like/Domain of unknown function (DUF1918)
MRASLGDRIVIASNRLDHPLRDGKIVECRNADGSPPYLVEWSDTGQTGFFFPGPDAHVQHFADEDTRPRGGGDQASGEAEPQRHVKTWRVEVSLFESGDDTTAHAVLVAEVPGIDATGRAYRHPHDPDVPEIGDEVAVARALRRLSDRLLGVAADDIAALEGHRVALNR